MTTAQQKNEALVKNIYRLVEETRYDSVQDLVSDSVAVHIGEMTLDRNGWLGMAKMFMGAFPDGVHAFERVISTGDYVVTVARFTGTHTGPFQALPPTGKRVSFPVLMVDRIVDGKVVEHRGEFDTAIMMRQLGVGVAG